MDRKPELLVTLSKELLDSLRAKARELRLPLKYLVASLICDTMDSVSLGMDERSGRRKYHVA